MNAKLNGLLVALCAAGAVSAVAEEADAPVVPEVSEVTMKQTGSRTVTITYKLANAPAVVTLDIQTNAANGAWVSIGGKNIQNFSAASDVFRQVSGKDTYTIKWHPDLSWSGHKIENGGARAVVTAWALDNTPDYLVVDLTLTGGAGTERYYPGEDFLPGGILDNPMYRTTSIVMRKIMAKNVTWTMGTAATDPGYVDLDTQHNVTLDHNYYMGVFPITQSQYRRIQPGQALDESGKPIDVQPWFTNVSYAAMRPMEMITLHEIRHTNCRQTDTDANVRKYYWPNDPNPDSFLGKLRAKTGVDFEIPSEAEWEFACRAGTGDSMWGDGNPYTSAADMGMPGRCAGNTEVQFADAQEKASAAMTGDPASRNSDLSGGTMTVGSYGANRWGLYDTHGNVREWCLDWLAGAAAIVPLNGEANVKQDEPWKRRNDGANSSTRLLRGGAWCDAASACTSGRRINDPSYERWRYSSVGVRLIAPMGLK